MHGICPGSGGPQPEPETDQSDGGFASPYTHFSAGINEPLLDGIAEVMHSQDYDAFF